MTEDTLFFDAFTDLKLDDRLFNTFSSLAVTKATASKSQGKLIIETKSDKLIKGKDIKRMEKILFDQMFSQSPYKPYIAIEYDFAKNFSLTELLELYEEELFDDIELSRPMDAYLFCREHFSVEGDTIVINCEDDVFVKGRCDSFEKYIKAKFKRHFAKDVAVKFEFVEKKPREKKTEYEVYPTDEREAAPIDRNDAPEKTTEEEASVATEPKTVNDGKKWSKRSSKNYSKNAPEPGLIYGKSVEGDRIDICDLVDGIGEVVVEGMIRNVDFREIKNERVILIGTITDFTDTICFKAFLKKEEIEEYSIKEFIKKGAFLRIKGNVSYDEYDKKITIGYIRGIKETENFTTKRKDTSEYKRVELHAHTQMSDVDGMCEVGKLVGRAASWGHPAIAITDHGVVQSFPDAYSAAKDAGDDFKVIFGCEIYLVDETEETVVKPAGRSLDDSYVVFDIETTGFSPKRDKIIEIGAVKVENGSITDRYSTFIDPLVPIPPRIKELTKITDDMVRGQRTIEEVLPEFLQFCEGCILVAHNAKFDHSHIREKARMLGVETDFTVVDTVGIARVLFPHMAKFKLDAVAKVMKISLENHHRAVEDAEATAQIFVKMLPMLKNKGIENLDELYEYTHHNPDIIKKLPMFHTIVLCANEVGRVNLYRLVSMSHLDYFYRKPRVPKSDLAKYREGLIIGSACEAGELYQAIIDDADEDVIEKIANFYDYLEVQPVANNAFMIESDRRESYRKINSFDDLREINKQIVKLADKLGKPVCATSDEHFLDPDDGIYRDILFAGKKMADQNNPPLYLRTTDEMLEEFSYLGEEKAFEVVVKNTNLIADRIEVISPVFPGKCPPIIPDSDKLLREICYRKAHQMYGEELPEVVKERLERELNSIISNGFAVMYIIAQKLVWKSVEDGYLVGSRGSVGSSFAATMAGITEVNPLPAHYYCGKCHYSDFDSEEVKKYSGSSGYDMPPKKCPVCGEELIRDGHDIPFETFLGFYGNKEPDIDLNFSGEYQPKAHAYTEVIFGDGQTYRAGTVGTIAEKTAYGYVKKYFEEKQINKRPEEIERLLEGVQGVKANTGQHPGGIVVLPLGWDINTFTPVQHPANDQSTTIVTTHYDYHKIDSNLLKLDILGHDDPTMIRMLEDLTGVDATQIPLDDEKVLSLFAGTDALGVTPDDLMGTDLGSLGVPEMGTEFVMQMLRDTKPKNFSDLVRISGLSHGTDVWLNNAQYYIKKGDCTLSTAICTRDDIMTYLIYTGVEKGRAFDIMEKVRKGAVAKGKVKEWGEWKEDMISHGVPEWYVESCQKIKYMFPKAHAVAYVMMAFRIAWFKVYYPLAYYAAFFSIRAKAFSYVTMCTGKDRLEAKMREYAKRSKSKDYADKLSDIEKNTYGDMKIVQEMLARGYEFAPIELEKADAKRFTITDDGKIMPSFSAIDGMGPAAAEGIADAVKDGPFSSLKNFKDRTKVSQTVIDKMVELGILGGLPADDQISLLDLM